MDKITGNKGRVCTCIIGARCGSKRLPGKNKEFIKGIPLYAITLEAAIEANVFGNIIFSTDDEEILEGLTKYSDIVIDHRPADLSGDDVIMWDVGIYILNEYSNILKDNTELCFLSPCHPFRNSGHIRNSYQLFRKSEAESLIGVTPFPSPPELSLEMVNNKITCNWSGIVRKGNYKKKYYPNGTITFVNREYFVKHKDVYSPNTVGYVLDWPYCLDIDYEEDLRLARMMFERLIENKENGSGFPTC